MVRNDDHRRSLFELDSAIQTIAIDRGHADAAIVQLTGVYHNLLRQWADV
jgi:PKHD-type hydroxylase